MLYHNLHALLLPFLDCVPGHSKWVIIVSEIIFNGYPMFREYGEVNTRDSVNQNTPYVNHMILYFLSISQET